jgi:hypothetical protein
MVDQRGRVGGVGRGWLFSVGPRRAGARDHSQWEDSQQRFERRGSEAAARSPDRSDPVTGDAKYSCGGTQPWLAYFIIALSALWDCARRPEGNPN